MHLIYVVLTVQAVHGNLPEKAHSDYQFSRTIKLWFEGPKLTNDRLLCISNDEFSYSYGFLGSLYSYSCAVTPHKHDNLEGTILCESARSVRYKIPRLRMLRLQSRQRRRSRLISTIQGYGYNERSFTRRDSSYNTSEQAVVVWPILDLVQNVAAEWWDNEVNGYVTK